MKDPEEAADEKGESSEEKKPEEVSMEAAMMMNTFQTGLTIIDEQAAVKRPTKKSTLMNEETMALDMMKLLNEVGWNRTETVKKFLGTNDLYKRKTYRHEWFCVREEMDNLTQDKMNLDVSSMTEKERLTIFKSSTFGNQTSWQLMTDCFHPSIRPRPVDQTTSKTIPTKPSKQARSRLRGR